MQPAAAAASETTRTVRIRRRVVDMGSPRTRNRLPRAYNARPFGATTLPAAAAVKPR